MNVFNSFVLCLSLFASFGFFDAQLMGAVTEPIKAEEWKAPEEPKNEVERVELEKKVREEEKAIENEDVSNPDVQRKMEEIKAGKAVLDTFDADQRLQKNSKDTTAQKDRIDAQTRLADAIKTIDSMIEKTFVPSGGKGTVLDQFGKNFDSNLKVEIDTIKKSTSNTISAKGKEYNTIEGELDAIKNGKKSRIDKSIDYNLHDYAREKKVLIALDAAVNKELIGFDKVKVDLLKKDIEDRIKEIDAFKSRTALPNNALDAQLDLANKIPSDSLKNLRDTLSSKNFNDSYKSVSERLKAFKDLKQVLDTYNLSYSDFFALNDVVSPEFISFLVQYAVTEGDQIGFLKMVMNDAVAKGKTSHDYASEKTELEFLKKSLDDLSLKKEFSQITDDIKKQVTKRIDEIDTFIKNRPAKAPTGSLAEKLGLSDMMPEDRMNAITKQYVDGMREIQKVLDYHRGFDKGENLYSWERGEVIKFEELVKPMQEFLKEVNDFYSIGDDKVYGERFMEMSDPVSSLMVQIENAKNQETVTDTAINLLSDTFSYFFSFKTGLESGLDIESELTKNPEKAVDSVSEIIEKINKAMDKAIIKQGEALKIISATAVDVASYMKNAPDFLNYVSETLDMLEKSLPFKVYVESHRVAIKYGVSEEAANTFKELVGSSIEAAQNFVNNPAVQEAAGQVAKAGGVLEGAANIVKEVGDATKKAGEAALGPDEKLQKQLESIKLAEAWVKSEKDAIGSPREQSYLESFRKIFSDFAKKISTLIKTKFTTDINTRYSNAATKYTSSRNTYFSYLGVGENATPDAIRAAMEKKTVEDPSSSKKELQNVVKNIVDMTKAIADAQQTLQAVQGDIKFLVDAYDNISVSQLPDKASAADIVNKIFEMRDKKIAYLSGIQEAIKSIQNDITGLTMANTPLDTISKQFIDGLQRKVEQELSKTINDYKVIIDGIEAKLQEQGKSLEQQAGR